MNPRTRLDRDLEGLVPVVPRHWLGWVHHHAGH